MRRRAAAAVCAWLLGPSLLCAQELLSTAAGPAWVRIPAQTFQMGCVPHDRECSANEQPRHAVRLTRDFWMMAHEVTVMAFREHAAKAGQIGRAHV